MKNLRNILALLLMFLVMPLLSTYAKSLGVASQKEDNPWQISELLRDEPIISQGSIYLFLSEEHKDLDDPKCPSQVIKTDKHDKLIAAGYRLTKVSAVLFNGMVKFSFTYGPTYGAERISTVCAFKKQDKEEDYGAVPRSR